MSNEIEVVNNNKNIGKMVNIISKTTDNGQLMISLEDTQYYYLPFDKSILDLSDPKIRNQFIKSVERRVRRSKLYKAYIDYLKSDLRLDRCAIFGNIKSEIKSKTKVEMHHGPIFTLYDYVEIVLEKYLTLNESDKLNTFDIAAEVLDLHKRKLVQTVMLSESAHKAQDNKKLAPFISLDQTFGDIYGFIEEYHPYFTPRHINNIKTYLSTYEYNMKHNKINMFQPIFTKYNIKFKEN